MWIDKAATWKMAAKLGGATLVKIIQDDTHTCYLGNRTTQNDWGFGCGECPACVLRKEGYVRFMAEVQ